MNAHTTPIAPQQARNRAPIPRRKMEFDFHSAEERFWFANNGLITAMLSALSATFPPGEKEFVQSVMHYRDQISDPVLLEQMKGFASQEGHHSYQHRQANAWLDTKGTATDEDMAMAKVFSSEMCQFVTDEAIQILGGMGLMDELPLERMWRDTRVDRIWDGTSEIQRHIISRAMLRPYGA